MFINCDTVTYSIAIERNYFLSYFSIKLNEACRHILMYLLWYAKSECWAPHRSSNRHMVVELCRAQAWVRQLQCPASKITVLFGKMIPASQTREHLAETPPVSSEPWGQNPT